MNKEKPSFLEAVKTAAWNGIELYACENAIVLSVDEDNFHATVSLLDENEETVTYTARLRSCTVDEDKGFIIVPAEGSIVTVGFLDMDDKETIVIRESTVEKVILNCVTSIEIKITDNDTSKFLIDENGIVFGENGSEPFVRGNELKTWAQDVDAKIQALLTWAGTGQAPGPSGGIAPLQGVNPPEFADTILSEEYKMK